MVPRRIDGLLIDFYGTISGGDREAVESTCRRIIDTCGLRVSAAEFAVQWGERFFAVVERSNHDCFQTLFECEKVSLRATLGEFGDDRDPAPFLAGLEDFWANPLVYPDAIEFLDSVDLPVCCVSNADTSPLLAAISKHNLCFDAVISSEAVRCYKPEPRIFRKALDALGIAPEYAIHIGDSLHSDIAGAAKLGITAVWLCRKNRIHDIAQCHPDYTIETLNEFPALFLP